MCPQFRTDISSSQKFKSSWQIQQLTDILTPKVIFLSIFLSMFLSLYEKNNLKVLNALTTIKV